MKEMTANLLIIIMIIVVVLVLVLVLVVFCLLAGECGQDLSCSSSHLGLPRNNNTLIVQYTSC